MRRNQLRQFCSISKRPASRFLGFTLATSFSRFWNTAKLLAIAIVLHTPCPPDRGVRHPDNPHIATGGVLGGVPIADAWRLLGSEVQAVAVGVVHAHLRERSVYFSCRSRGHTS